MTNVLNVPPDILEFTIRWREKTKDYGTEDLAYVFDHFFHLFSIIGKFS